MCCEDSNKSLQFPINLLPKNSVVLPVKKAELQLAAYFFSNAQ